MIIPIDEVVHFDVTTHVASTGAVSDADSAPTFDVFEEATDTPILDDQTMTKRTSLTGNYRGAFTASAANGFEAGKWYVVIVSATVSSVSAKHVAKSFRVGPAESSAGVPKVDVSHAAGTAWASGAITAASIAADAITDAKVASDVTIASVTGAVGSVTGAVGSVTGSVGSIATGGITTASFATGAINAAAIGTDAITDAKVASDVTIASVTGAVGSVTAGVTVTTNNDKTGYGLSAAAVQAIWDALTSALTTVSSIGKLLVDNINATISSRLASASYTTPPTVGAIADQVWEETLADHSGTSGSTAAALNAAGSAGDPWSTALPGAYGAGTAGKIIGDNINATISSRATPAQVATELATYDAPTKAELDAAVAPLATSAALATVDAIVDDILADTAAMDARLPSDPADQSLIIAATSALDTKLGSPAGASVSADIADIEGKVDDLETRLTAQRATNLDNLDATVSSRLASAGYTAPPSAATNASAVRTELGVELGRVDAAISTRATPAQVNTEVLDVLTVDTFGEPSAVPAATATILDRLRWLFTLGRNKQTSSGTTLAIRNDGDTADVGTAAQSDDGTYTRGKWS